MKNRKGDEIMSVNYVDEFEKRELEISSDFKALVERCDDLLSADCVSESSTEIKGLITDFMKGAPDNITMEQCDALASALSDLTLLRDDIEAYENKHSADYNFQTPTDIQRFGYAKKALEGHLSDAARVQKHADCSCG